MKSILRHLALATTLLTAGAAFAESHDEMQGMKGMQGMQHGNIQVQHPYARAVPPGQPNSAAFMTLRNMGGEANALIAASSPAANVVELHTHTMDDGMMKMRRVEQIDIPAKGETELKPGGLHIMLIGLKQQLKPGIKVALTLKFSDGTESTVDAPVQDVMQSMGHMPAEHHPMQH
jgi:copper(I)-binding protein